MKSHTRGNLHNVVKNVTRGLFNSDNISYEIGRTGCMNFYAKACARI